MDKIFEVAMELLSYIGMGTVSIFVAIGIFWITQEVKIKEWLKKLIALSTNISCDWHYGDGPVKSWFKRFLRGTYIACCMIIVIGVAFIMVRLGIWLLIIGAVIGGKIDPTTNNITIMLCIFFVVVFGLIWSTWD